MKHNVKYITPFDSNVELLLYFPSEKEIKEKKYRWNMYIIRFKWGNLVYRTIREVSNFENRDGNNLLTNYTVETESNHIVQLQINHKDLKWTLIKISLAK